MTNTSRAADVACYSFCANLIAGQVAIGVTGNNHTPLDEGPWWCWLWLASVIVHAVIFVVLEMRYQRRML